MRHGDFAFYSCHILDALDFFTVGFCQCHNHGADGVDRWPKMDEVPCVPMGFYGGSRWDSRAIVVRGRRNCRFRAAGDRTLGLQILGGLVGLRPMIPAARQLKTLATQYMPNHWGHSRQGESCPAAANLRLGPIRPPVPLRHPGPGPLARAGTTWIPAFAGRTIGVRGDFAIVLALARGRLTVAGNLELAAGFGKRLPGRLIPVVVYELLTNTGLPSVPA